MTKKKSQSNNKYFQDIPTPKLTQDLGDLYRKRLKHIESERYHKREVKRCTHGINEILAKFAGVDFDT